MAPFHRKLEKFDPEHSRLRVRMCPTPAIADSSSAKTTYIANKSRDCGHVARRTLWGWRAAALTGSQVSLPLRFSLSTFFIAGDNIKSHPGGNATVPLDRDVY